MIIKTYESTISIIQLYILLNRDIKNKYTIHFFKLYFPLSQPILASLQKVSPIV